jgi:LDH2 family malate/lactate/ureidoglycolate dehydrogenase
MSNLDRNIPVKDLQDYLTKLFAQTGMGGEDAAYCAYALVQTNLWGIDSHGVLRAPVYLDRLITRAVNPTPTILPVRGDMALEVLDGDDGMGFVVGKAAMERAIILADQFNLGAVGVVRSNHFGAAALYAQLATQRGMVGIVMTSVMPNIVAPGGSRPITGNNPIAVGIPTFGEFPFMLDISLSNAAGGKLLLASKKGEKIPLNWATDKHGHPTDDPDEAFAGFLLPVGGHKGLGLSYMVDLLSGLITGGAFQYAIKSMYKNPEDPSLTGHFMIVINPLALMSQEALTARMADYVKTIKESPMWDENQEMILPGEMEYRKSQTRQRDGIPVPPNLYDDLVAMGEKLGVAITF